MKNRSSYAVLTRLGILGALLATLAFIAPAVFANALEFDFPEDSEDLTVATFSASDPDADAGDIEWGKSGPDADLFDIDGGVLSFKKAPNFESPGDGDESDASGLQGYQDNVYKVTVTASGGSQDVVVTVKDADEPGSVSFDKPQPQVTRELTASLSDDDNPLKPSWSWSKSKDKDAADEDWMSVSGTSAKRTPVASDAGYYLRATVTYEDTFGTKTESGVTDNVVEDETLANARPTFGTIGALTVEENVSGPLGDPILPTDPDGDVMQLALDGTTGDNSLFGYNASGQLSVKGEDGLNYETELTRLGALSPARPPNPDDSDDGIPDGALIYTVMIKATDPSGAVGTGEVTVYLTNANEAPKFGAAAADANQKTLYVDEGATPNLRVGMTGAAGTITYTAEDEDGTTLDDAPVLTIEGADAKYFDISGGTLTPIAAVPDPNPDGKAILAADFEDKDSYSITVVAASTGATGTTGRGTMHATLAVTIKVVDGEDAGSASFVGGTRAPLVGRSVLASFSDPDGGVTGAKWQWFRGATEPADAAARTTLITTLSGLLDGTQDDPDEGTNRVCGDDGNGTTVDATVDGSTACVINGATSSLYVPSAATDNTDVGFTIHALVSYTDAQGSATEYAIVSSEGVVQDRNPANTAPKFPDQDLNTLGDQSDTAMRSVRENEKENVGEPIPANDADTADNGLLIYTLSGADEANFSVDNSGQIKTKVELDFETQDMHTVVLTATDPSGASDSIMVMITVIDGPDNAIITGVETFDFPEDSEDLTVATFSASDPDADAGDIEWGKSGPDADLFDIDGGVLSFKKAPNFESPGDGDESDASGLQGYQDNVYKVTVTASGGSQDVVVTVKDADEPGSVSFDKPQPQVTRELTASLSDDDNPLKPSWSWSKSKDKDAADEDWMSVSGTSAKRTPVASDAGYYLRATVTYEDTFGTKTESGVTDNVVEDETLANARPTFGTIGALTVEENVSGPLGDPILPTDPDGDVMQLALDGTTGDNSLFGYNASGQLSVKGEDGLNYETELTRLGALSPARPPNPDDSDDGIPDGALIYTVMIKATDPSGAVGTGEVTVYLTNANEAPKFGAAAADANQKTLYVDEGATPNLRVGMTGAAGTITYTAEDEDGTTLDDAPVLTIEGADAKYFDISGGTLTPIAAVPDPNPDGKAILAADFEDKDSYSITVVAASTGATGTTGRGTMHATLAVTIKVVDGEDAGSASFVGGTRAPLVGRSVLASFSDPDGGVTGAKWQWFRGATEPADAAARTTLITTLSGLLDGTQDDPDEGTNRVCGDDGNGTTVDATVDGSTACVINGATSSLYVPSAATDNTDVGFTIHALVSYTDAQGSATEYAIVSSEGVVQDRNPANTAPKFPDQDLNTLGDQSDTAMRSVRENEKENVGEPIPANDADTADNGLLIYTLSGADEANFSVDNSGQIKTKVELDFETQDMHTVVLTATDPSGASDSIMVMITVIDGPDTAIIQHLVAPEFASATMTREVAENEAAGTNVGDPVTAIDPNGDVVTYMISDSDYFDIDSATGQITTKVSLDYETMASHEVTVTASDGTDSSDVTVTINVTDVEESPCVVGGAIPDGSGPGLDSDCQTLLDIMDDLVGDGEALNWSLETPMGDWDGVSASDVDGSDRVTNIYLAAHGLAGTIPAGISGLDALKRLTLRDNDLTGDLPAELGDLDNLEWLILHRNAFTGSIPAELGDMASIDFLYLYSNEGGFEGGIPAELGNATSLRRLYLHDNGLTGEIPSELGGLSRLRNLLLHRNDLSGEIPAELGSLSNLKALYLYSNMLTGSIPAELGNLVDASGASARLVYLHNNMLSGDVPAELGNLVSLTRLLLSGNMLTGCIPAAIIDAAEDAEAAGLMACAAEDES